METTADPITTTHVDDPSDEVVFDEPKSRAFWFSGTEDHAWWLVVATLSFGFAVGTFLFGENEQPLGARSSTWWVWPLIALAGVLLTRALTDLDPEGVARVRPRPGEGIRTRTILPLVATIIGLAAALGSTDDVYHATELPPDDRTRRFAIGVVCCVVAALAVVACLAEAYRRYRKRRAGC